MDAYNVITSFSLIPRAFKFDAKFSTKELALYISNKTGLPKKIIYNKIIEYKSK